MINKITNEYAQEIARYDRIPKAVFAALAVSFALQFVAEDDLDAVEDALLSEWEVLYQQGIIPQRPAK